MAETPPPHHPSRRDFLRAGATAAGLSILGCSTDSGHAPELSAASRKQINDMGLEVALRPDDHNPEKSVIQLRIHGNARGRAIEALNLAPLGVEARYRDGTHQTVDLTFDALAQQSLSGDSTRMHVQVADPERKNLRLAIRNPEDSGSTLTVFVDRQGTPGKASRHTRPNPLKMQCEVDISEAGSSKPNAGTHSVVALDARVGGDSRNIEMTVTGLNPEQQALVREIHDSRKPGAKPVYHNPPLRQSDALHLHLGAVEVRGTTENPVHFSLGSAETISDAVGRNASSKRGNTL